ncbi:Ion channel [Dirofilaria immitis]|nr:Ion channel [Dirofilaria immitis]
MVWNLARLGNEQEYEGLEVLQKFCRRKYRHSLTNALRSSRDHKLECVTEDVRSVESAGLNIPADAIDHGEYNIYSEGTNQPSVYDVIEEILNSRSKPSQRNPIKMMWYNLEFKFGRWIKCVLLLLVLIAYALFGGLLVHQFEAPAERNCRTLQNLREKISELFMSPLCQSSIKHSDDQNSTEIAPLLKQITCNRRLERLLVAYDEQLGISAYKQNPWRWADYWNAVFYCGTIFTTIVDSCICTQYLALYPERSEVLCNTFYIKDSMNEEDDAYETFPIYGVIVIIVVYIALCSFIFRIWEHWDYFTAFYFFFISLTTVGLGDEMPDHPHFACVFFIFFIVGLALVSMCISSVQMEFEMKFMKAINLIDEYSRERQRGPIRFMNSVPVLNPLAFIPTVSNDLTKERYLSYVLQFDFVRCND